MKHLIIVESPAKARTIKNFLGRNYDVIASKGHIRDLPKSSFGITEAEDGTLVPKYTVSKDVSATVKEIKEKAKKSDQIYIATDEDREGEAIGWHIAHAIKKDPTTLPRIVFHEITKKAIKHALENPRHLDGHRIDAQQARRMLDRIVGYKLSPLLSSKIQKGLSAGRVQSSSLKIIVDREREIKAFIPQEYWSISAKFDDVVEANLFRFEDQKIDKLTINDETFAMRIVNTIKNESFVVAKLEKKERKTSTNPPFMTSTLQQTASSRLGFTPKRTMMIAQTLYEGVKTDRGTVGLITYMRTDSLNIAAEALEAVREKIGTSYGDKYLPTTPKYYKSKSQGAQEAHEAIRPTMIDYTPQMAASHLKPEELKLYTLIYNRFIASQMTDAIYESQSLIFESHSSQFKATGRRLVFDGFYKVMGISDQDKLLPELTQGAEATLSNLTPTQHFTEPPSRYSEASLIKELEAQGIGRPSTYAPTIAILASRDYLNIEKKQLIPTEVAFTVTETLEKHFPEIVDSAFTANMENVLDEVAENKKDWQEVLKAFYSPFMKQIDEAKTNIKSQKMAEPTGIMCPKCGSELLKRKGRYGEFLACSGFPKCRHTQPVDGEAAEIKADEPSDEKCEKCGSDMVIKEGRNGKFLACSAYPKCKNTKSIDEPAQKVETPCPDCGGELLLRKSRRGAFFGCKNYPDCKFISKFEPTDKKCSECGYVMAKRTYRNKEVYECIKCKHREDQ
jgi:DNA topoisomerase-1